MAKFVGFTCDEDGVVVGEGQRHRQIIRIEGPSVAGQVERDLCPACALRLAGEAGPLGPVVHRRHLPTAILAAEPSPEPVADPATSDSSD